MSLSPLGVKRSFLLSCDQTRASASLARLRLAGIEAERVACCDSNGFHAALRRSPSGNRPQDCGNARELLCAWRNLLRRQCVEAIAIFEDDVYFKLDFPSALSRHASQLQRADVVYLGASVSPQAWRPPLAVRYGKPALEAAQAMADALAAQRAVTVIPVDCAWVFGTYALVLSPRAQAAMSAALPSRRRLSP